MPPSIQKNLPAPKSSRPIWYIAVWVSLALLCGYLKYFFAGIPGIPEWQLNFLAALWLTGTSTFLGVLLVRHSDAVEAAR